jgi:hypothetical protein
MSQDWANFVCQTWTRRNIAQWRLDALEFKNAPSKASRARVFQRTGVRWSELLELDYWDPTKSVVVDAMHNLFLNLVKHHCREILQIDLLGDMKDEESVPVATPKEMAAAREIWAKGLNLKKKLSKIKVPALLALCIEKNIVLPRPDGGRRVLKSQIIDALLSASGEPAEDEEGEGDNEVGCHAEFGTYDEPTERQVDDDLYRDGVIGHKELRQIRKDIASTIRPGWQTGPPANFGSPAHGKPKADQWRSSIEFDIPVSLVQLWAACADILDDDRRQKMVDSTMFLATAIRWATSYRTSPRHADEYTKNMRAYLESLRDLFPEMKLRPNHHIALYLGEFLLRFGPVHGWWMFPFERLIGLLQKVNTNKKIGKSTKLIPHPALKVP